MPKTSTALPTRRVARALATLFLVAPLAYASASEVTELASEDWIAIQSPHFRVVTEQSEEVARRMIVDLENLRYISNRVRGAQSLDGPPLTMVVMGKENFRKLGVPENVAAQFTISRKGYVSLASIRNYVYTADRVDVSRSTLLHEYHHFLLHYSPETMSYPMWYDEGMSEYWSSLKIEDGKAWFGHPVENARTTLWLAEGRHPKFDTRTLFKVKELNYDGKPENRNFVSVFYTQSRYVIHYFQSTPALRQQLANYLRLHNMGLSQDQAVRLAFNRSYAALDMDVRDYTEHHLTVRGFSIGKDGLDLPQVPVQVTRLDRGAAISVLAEVVPRFTRSSVAIELIRTDLQLHPDDPDANTRALDYRVVTDRATRLPGLLQRYPNNARVLTMRADQLRMAAAGTMRSGATAMPSLLEARALYRRAIQADPTYPAPYFGLGNLYMQLPENEPVDEGIAGLDTAAIYEPSPETFRALARLYLRGKQLGPALKSMRSAVAFGARADRPFDVLLMENLEVLADMGSGATPDDKGLRYKSGSTYEGATRDGKPHGEGLWSRPNGSYYQGEFVNGLPSGHGKLFNERGVYYEGDFVKGMARGAGHIGFPEASRFVSYDGGVADGVPAGTGVLVTKDGTLESTFADGAAHGKGTFTPTRTGTAMTGTWTSGGYQWPAADGFVYLGGIDANGRRHGRGWCREEEGTGVRPCVYVEGRWVPPAPGDD